MIFLTFEGTDIDRTHFLINTDIDMIKFQCFLSKENIICLIFVCLNCFMIILSYHCLSKIVCLINVQYLLLSVCLSVIQWLYIQFCPIIVCIFKKLSEFVCLIIICIELSVLSVFCLYFLLYIFVCHSMSVHTILSYQCLYSQKNV